VLQPCPFYKSKTKNPFPKHFVGFFTYYAETLNFSTLCTDLYYTDVTADNGIKTYAERNYSNKWVCSEVNSFTAHEFSNEQ